MKQPQIFCCKLIQQKYPVVKNSGPIHITFRSILLIIRKVPEKECTYSDNATKHQCTSLEPRSFCFLRSKQQTHSYQNTATQTIGCCQPKISQRDPAKAKPEGPGFFSPIPPPSCSCSGFEAPLAPPLQAKTRRGERRR